MCQRQRRQRRVTHDEALGEASSTSKLGLASSSRKRVGTERGRPGAALKESGRDKIRTEKQHGGPSGTKKGDRPTFFSSPSPSLLLLFFCFSFSVLPFSCPFVPLTTTSLFAPNHDAVPSILHSRSLVTSFDRPLSSTVDSPGPGANRSNQSALIPGWCRDQRPGQGVWQR